MSLCSLSCLTSCCSLNFGGLEVVVSLAQLVVTDPPHHLVAEVTKQTMQTSDFPLLRRLVKGIQRTTRMLEVETPAVRNGKQQELLTVKMSAILQQLLQ